MSNFIVGNQYTGDELNESEASSDPFVQFQQWFDAAKKADIHEPTAMTLATATPDAKPSARVVLLKSFDQHGFVFYTNYQSQKSRELAANPHAALVFYWDKLGRSVRITGTVDRISREQSEAYFHSRPRESQLGAVASRQSEVIADRQTLEQQLQHVTEQYEGKKIDMGQDWGGYCLAPDAIEFWLSRPSRLHDRLLYRRQSDGTWRIERLSP